MSNSKRSRCLDFSSVWNFATILLLKFSALKIKLEPV